MHSLLRGIFPTQGSNLGLLHSTCIGRRILNHWTTREVPLMASDLSACHDGDHDTAAHTWRHEHFSNGGSHDRTIFASLGLRLFQAFALHLSLVKAPRFRNKKVREPHRYFREWCKAARGLCGWGSRPPQPTPDLRMRPCGRYDCGRGGSEAGDGIDGPGASVTSES